MLGEAARVDRVNVIRYDHDGQAGKLVSEWARSGIQPISSFTSSAFGYEDYREVWDVLLCGDVYWSPTSEKTGANRELNDKVSTTSDLHVPIMVRGEFWGLINFDDCGEDRERTWDSGEIEVLRAAAETFAAAIAADRARSEAVESVARAREAAALERAASLKSANDDLRARDRLITATASALSLLLGTNDFDGAVRRALQIVAEAAGLHRAKVILSEPGTTRHVLSHEWWSPELRSQASHGLVTFDDAAIRPYIEQCRRGETLFQSIEDVAPGLRESFERVGMKSMGVVPILAGGEYQGLVAFDECRSRREWSVAEMETLTSAGHAIGATILQRRHEAARADAVARERERAAAEHAAELQDANAALNRAVQGLVSLTDLDGFLEALLRESLTIAGAHTGAFAVIDGDVIDHVVLFDRGGLVPRECSLRQGTARIARTPEVRSMEQSILESEEFWTIDPRGDVNPPSFTAFHETQGNAAVRCVPMRVGDRLIGWLGLGFATTEPPTAQRLTLLRVLAEHATVAVELNRLATETREAALSRERARAEGERAERAERTGRVMAGVAEAGRAMLDAETLESGLRSWCERLGAACSVHRCGVGQFVLQTGCDNPIPVNVVDWTAEGVAPMGRRAIPATSDFTEWGARLLRGEVVVAGFSELRDPASREFWAATDCGYNVIVPVEVAGKAWGYAYFDFREERPPDQALVDVMRTAVGHVASAVRRHAAERRVDQERAARSTAVVEERTRLAREVHDTLAQGLVGILMNVRQAAASATADSAAGPYLRTAERLARESLEAARKSVRALRPGSPDALSLKESVRHLCEVARERSGVCVDLQVPSGPLELPGEVADEFHRIAQEAIHNAVRHAGPQSVILRLEPLSPMGVRLSVADDGRGFDPDYPVPGHFGLVGMQERAARVGAAVTIISEIGRGTEVVAAWRPSAGGDPARGAE